MHHENPDVSFNNSAILERFLDSSQFPCSPTAFIRLPRNWLVLCRQIQEWGQYTLLSSLGSRVFEDAKFKKVQQSNISRPTQQTLNSVEATGGGGWLPPL